MRARLVIISLAGWSSASAQSPYLGGRGDGHSASVVANRHLDGVTPAVTGFLGGPGDGHSGKLLDSWNLGQPVPPSSPVPYAGGGGDGFAPGMLANRNLGPAPDAAWAALARGGSGDGFAVARGVDLNLTPLPPDPPPSGPYFAGSGGGDGFAGSTLPNRQLGPVPDPGHALIVAGGTGGGDGHAGASIANRMLGPTPDPAFTTIVQAGPSGGDGFSAASVVSWQLGAGPTADIAYSAGASGGDGFGGSTLLNRMLGAPFEPVYTIVALGGTGDGFAASSALNFPLGTSPWPLDPFLGGAADGFDPALLANFQMEIRIGSPVTFAGFQEILFTPAEIAAGLADPSADADGDGVSNLMEFVLGTAATDSGSAPSIPSALAGPEDFGLPGDGNDYLILDVPLSPFALGVDVGVEFSSDLGILSWSPGDVLISTSSRLLAKDPEPVGTSPARFGRVTATLSPP